MKYNSVRLDLQGIEVNNKSIDFKILFIEKQKLQNYYTTLLGRQIRTLFLYHKSTHKVLIQLESRLDIIVYRMNFAKTMNASRQYITHGHVTVNNIKTKLPGYYLRPGDVVKVRPTSSKVKEMHSQDEFDTQGSLKYLKVDYVHRTGILLTTPKIEEVPYPYAMKQELLEKYYLRF